MTSNTYAYNFKKRMANLARLTKKHVLILVLFFNIILNSSCENSMEPDFIKSPGPILFVSDKSGTSQLYSMEADGSNIQQITDDPNFPVYDAVWSPDGKKIALVSLTPDEMTYPFFRRVIFIINSDGSERKQVVPQWIKVDDTNWGEINYGGVMKPVWSYDSKRLAYSRLMVPEALGNFDIFIINIDGSEEKRVTETMNFSENISDWSRNEETLLAYTVDATTSKVFIFDLDGNKIKTWESNDSIFSVPVYSTKGDRIALAINSVSGGVQSFLYVINVANERKINISNGNYDSYRPIAWSNDDRKILTKATDKNTREHFLIIDSEGTEEKDITPFKGSTVFITSWRRN